jgi:transposase InsO family protein
MRYERPSRFAIRDRAGQYSETFDNVFSAVDVTVINIPPRAPRANAFAQRWVRTVRHELLDRTLIWNRQQLKQLLDEYVAHYNEHRPHRSLDQRAPADTVPQAPPAVPIKVTHRSTCGTLINEYLCAA